MSYIDREENQGLHGIKHFGQRKLRHFSHVMTHFCLENI